MLLVRIGKEAPPESRLTQVFRAAQKTDFYRHWLCSEDTLDPLPHVDIAHCAADPDRFRKGRGLTRIAAEFVYPIQPGPRVTVLADGFRRSAHVRVISDFDIHEAGSLKAETVAAPIGTLRELAKAGFSFEFPVVAFTGVRHGYMSSADRELLWDVFGVPVFEQLTGIDNEVLAEECEAHDGLHVRSSDAIFEFRGKELVVSSLSNSVHPALRLALGLTGRIEQSPCKCAKPRPRLMDLAPYQRVMQAAAG